MCEELRNTSPETNTFPLSLKSSIPFHIVELREDEMMGNNRKKGFKMHCKRIIEVQLTQGERISL